MPLSSPLLPGGTPLITGTPDLQLPLEFFFLPSPLFNNFSQDLSRGFDLFQFYPFPFDCQPELIKLFPASLISCERSREAPSSEC